MRHLLLTGPGVFSVCVPKFLSLLQILKFLLPSPRQYPLVSSSFPRLNLAYFGCLALCLKYLGFVFLRVYIVDYIHASMSRSEFVSHILTTKKGLQLWKRERKWNFIVSLVSTLFLNLWFTNLRLCNRLSYYQMM